MPKPHAPYPPEYRQQILELVQKVRTKARRNPKPSAGIIDSQSVKTSEGGEARGIDVHKQTPGRKRHIVIDTLGLLLLVVVHSASLQDAAGGFQTLQSYLSSSSIVSIITGAA